MFFMLFGLIYVIASFAFWKFSDAPLSQALFIPLLIAGGLLFSAGVSFYLTNKTKLAQFEKEYKEDPLALIDVEIDRTEKTIKTYENVALKVFPGIILLAAIIIFVISNPMVRAICIALIAFLSVLVILDSQALKRMKTYHHQLELYAKEILIKD